MKRARYDAHLAQWQYDAVDPDNRLVAVELDTKMGSEPAPLRETEEGFERFEQEPEAVLTPELRQQLRHIFGGVAEAVDRWATLIGAEGRTAALINRTGNPQARDTRPCRS